MNLPMEGRLPRRPTILSHVLTNYCVLRIAVAALIVFTCAQNLSAEDWNGWRGFERQGYNPRASCPTVWSADSNVLWHTPIPGRGHSSPIVAGDKVFVTTAYPATFGQSVRWTAIAIVIILWAFAVGLALRRAVRRCRAQGGMALAEFVHDAILLLLLGLVAASMVETHLAYTIDRKSLFFRWLHSGVMVALCMVIAFYEAPARSPWRRLAGVGALLLAAGVVIFRPDPGYYVLFARFDYHTLPLWIAAATVVATGIGILLPAFLRRTEAEPIDKPEQAGTAKPWWQHPRVLIGALLLGMLGLGILPFLGIRQIVWEMITGGRIAFPANVDGLAARFQFLFDPQYFGRHLLRMLVAAVFLLPWSAAGIAARAHRDGHRSRLIPSLILSAGILNFAAANYMGLKPELERAIICVDRATGAVRWTCRGLRGPESPAYRDNSPATPTPLVCDGRVAAWFGSTGMMCSDFNGRRLWVNTDLPYEDIHGVGASPVLADSLIVLDSSMLRAPYLAAIDPATGKRVWTTNLTPWQEGHGRHRTPTVMSLGDHHAILTWGWHQYGFAAHDARTGKELWHVPWKYQGGGEAVCSLLIDGDRFFACSAGYVQARSLSELAQRREGILWQTPRRGRGPNTASPLLCDGRLFMVSDAGFASCLDAENGELLWQEKLGQGEWLSSPVAAGGHVYFSNTEGITVVVAAAPRFRKIAENKLGEAIFASPAPVDDQLFIRTTKHLWCIGAK